MRRTTNLAAIDVGTNSFHLVVAQVGKVPGRYRILGREKEIVRLGTGSTDMKYLSDAAMRRGVEVLKRFRQVAESNRAQIRAVATSAVREALNREEFQRRVQTETGIRIEIASGAEEARLIHLGVLQALPVFRKRLLLVDIGGGSTEFLVGERRNILLDHSLKLGAVRLTERFFPGGLTGPPSVRECRKYLRGFLAPVTRDVRRKVLDVRVGSSGTILNLAEMIRLRRRGAPEGSLNGFVFTRSELRSIVEEVLEHPHPEDRAKIAGLDAARADILPAGALILEQVMEEFGLPDMTVSEFALREGIILDTIETRLVRRSTDHLHDIRRSSVRQLAEQFHSEMSHADHVTHLSLRIFDQLVSLHHYGSREREYLEAAAHLHEIGLFLSHAQHHRHSYYLIRNAELLGFSEEEKEIIANIARYHRKSHPKAKHEAYGGLGAGNQRLVARLAAILRVADGLDRNHAGNVQDVRVRRNRKRLFLTPKGRKGASLDLELWGAERKKGLLEQTFGVTVAVTPA